MKLVHVFTNHVSLTLSSDCVLVYNLRIFSMALLFLSIDLLNGSFELFKFLSLSNKCSIHIFMIIYFCYLFRLLLRNDLAKVLIYSITCHGRDELVVPVSQILSLLYSKFKVRFPLPHPSCLAIVPTVNQC